MGCVESTLLSAKHRLSVKRARQRSNFQIPDIVVEEYMSGSDALNKKTGEDYIWLTDTQFNRKRSDWFVHNCDSVNAEYLLRDKPDGTFLVRESSRYRGHFVLSITLHYYVNHLLIYQTDDGFGLNERGCHPTLDSLVTHYSQVSLKTKNPYLDTKLVNGVFQKSKPFN